MGLTRQIAEFAAAARTMPLDDDTIALVKTGVVDTMGVILAGRGEAVTTALLRFVEPHGAQPPDASLLLGPGRTSSRNAALVNAAAGHALDYDDVAFCGHPSVVMVPALWAEGERLRASGPALIAAYVVGYEVWASLFFRESDLLHAKGWHPTGVLGVVAATAAVAALRGFSVSQCEVAIGLASGMANGLVAQFGTAAKPFQAGQAAAQAIDACDLVGCGMTAAVDALEHRAGLLAALSPNGAVDRSPEPRPFGEVLRLRTLRLSTKNYPMCFATHRVVDATIAIAQRHDVAAHDVARVVVHIGRAQAEMLRNPRPTTGVEAKFSIEFAVAAALVARSIGLAQVDDAFVRSPAVQALIPKVEVVVRDTRREDQPALAASDRVVVTLHDGRAFDSGEVVFARGDAFLPMTTVDLRRKFDDCARAIEPTRASALFAALVDLEAVDDLRTLIVEPPVESARSTTRRHDSPAVAMG